MAILVNDSGQCTKANLYDLIISKFIAAGWTNVSSNPVTDGDVLYSTGADGKKQLYIQLWPLDPGGTGLNPISTVITTTVYNANNVKNTSANWIIGIRLVGGYTPNATAGSSGTFSDTRGWSRVALINSNATNITSDILVNYDIYVDKEKAIIHTKASDFSSTKDQLIYVGLPSTIYTNISKTPKRGMVFLAACQIGFGASIVAMNDYPDDMIGISNNWVQLAGKTLLLNKNPNIAMNYFMGDIYSYNDTYGMVNKLDGIYSVSQSNYLPGDLATIGANTYKILDVRTNWTSSANMFPSDGIAIQIA